MVTRVEILELFEARQLRGESTSDTACGFLTHAILIQIIVDSEGGQLNGWIKTRSVFVFAVSKDSQPSVRMFFQVFRE